MLKIINAKTPGGEIKDFSLQSDDNTVLDAEGKLTILPALIDPHVHFGVPGAEYKEDWKSAARAAIAGGVTTVIDMSNNKPYCTTKEKLEEKIRLIDQQLKEIEIPLRYNLYIGADPNHLDEIILSKPLIAGIKVYVGSSTGDLMSDEKALDRVFQIGAQLNLIVAVHAEDEKIIQENIKIHQASSDPSIHSKIRSRNAAIKATELAINLAEKYDTQLFLLHISTMEEIQLIKDARKKELLVYAEVSPHHLFLTELDYKKWGNKVKINPPLRTEKDQGALWEAIHEGVIDVIGSDHAPHTLEEKGRPYEQVPPGVPGVETLLPLLLNAFHEKKITLSQIIDLTRKNSEQIFRLEHNEDVVLVDLDKVQEVRDENLKTKCGWSPYSGKILKGWPVYTVLKGKVYRV